MLDPTTLFTYDKHIDSRTLTGETLLVTLDAFTDAGHAQEIIDEHLLGALGSRVIGRLDLDQVFDYGAHRPEITLERDRFLDYEKPEIVLHEITGPGGDPFYLLTGPEPTLEWERVAAALRIVVEQLGIRRIVLAQSFPAPVPHTRPLQITTYADEPSHIREPRPLPSTFRMRSSFTHLLTMRLGEAGHETVGLVAHVPQYLHEMGYPEAAIALLGAIETESGLTLPVGALAPAARETRQLVDEQVAQAPQLGELIANLERGYDGSLLAGAPGSQEGAPDAEMPSDEQISEEIERFLAELSGDEGTSAEPGDDEDGASEERPGPAL